jgi:hypothetical protein
VQNYEVDILIPRTTILVEMINEAECFLALIGATETPGPKRDGARCLWRVMSKA